MTDTLQRRMENLIRTILDFDPMNRREWLNLDRIAEHQGFDCAEFTALFAQLETERSLTPNYCEEMDK